MMFSSDPELESFSKILGAKNLTHSCSHRFTAGSGKEHLNCVQKAALRAGQRSDVLIKQMLILSGVKGTGTGRRFWGREKKKKNQCLQYAGQLSLGAGGRELLRGYFCFCLWEDLEQGSPVAAPGVSVMGGDR